MTSESDPAAAAWDAEYAAGRCTSEQPVAFTGDILAAARRAGAASGLYIGCGNGRNYLPLVADGLDLTGLDISAAAIAQLTARAPGRRDRIVHGDLSALPAGTSYPPVIGIQIFQHGDHAAAHAHIRATQQRLSPGGLLCLRVNATATGIWPRHEMTGHHRDGGFTVPFSTNAPQPGRPRLRCPGTPADLTVQSRQRGALQYTVGCFAAIRNPATHEHGEWDQQVALEYLAAFSMLARWIDDWNLEAAP